jgi:hypothetical protein
VNLALTSFFLCKVKLLHFSRLLWRLNSSRLSLKPGPAGTH